MKDLVGNSIKVGDLCYYLKAGTSVRVGVIKIIDFTVGGVVCEVINYNPTDHITRGAFYKDGHITKPIAPTNLIRCNLTL